MTHCEYFKELSDSRERPHQIQYEKETGEDGIVALADKVGFRFGYPCVIQKNSKNKEVLFLLPTMTDKMLIDEIVLSRLQPTSIKDALLYRTESERWITVGTDGFSMCERENEISDKLKIFPPVPIEELRTLYNRK